LLTVVPEKIRLPRVDSSAFFREREYFVSFILPGGTIIYAHTLSYFMAKI